MLPMCTASRGAPVARLRRGLLLLALAAGVLAGCGHSRPYYSGHLFEMTKVTEHDRSHLVMYLDWAIKTNLVRRIEVVTPQERSLIHPADAARPNIDWLPLPVLIGAWHILEKRLRGLELDLLTHSETGEYVPVTAQYDLDESVRITMGKPLRSLTELAVPLSPEQIHTVYGTGPIVNGTASWTPTELAALQQALAVLTPAERAKLADVRFVRNHRPTRTSGLSHSSKAWGAYYVDGSQKTISLFDVKIDHDESLFIGTPDKPLLASAACLLHEIGHGLASEPVLDSYRAARGWMRGPTPYGAKSLAESFAESFSLFRADPDALVRVAPQVHEWFLAGNHLRP
ncbi:MAG: hypothetical protein U1A78_23120 [Polyangia bacterium]